MRRILVEEAVGHNSGDRGCHPVYDRTDQPMPTVLQRTVRMQVLEDDRPSPERDHPPYRLPTMAEIAAIEPNGYEMVSTFSGAGGSCLGFEMEGFAVRWANEFVPAAQETYRANHPKTILDTRDVRTVTAADIMSTLGLDVGQLDVFEGSPPCSAFSTAGQRDAKWGKTAKYSDSRSQVVDDLFFEYARLLTGLRPKVFVAENVSGLVKGPAKGYFKLILRALEDAGYRVKAGLLDAQWLGVPQNRQRIIFVGVRDDLGVEPRLPAPLGFRYTLGEAIGPEHGPLIRDGHAFDPETDERIDILDTAMGREFERAARGESHRYFQLHPSSADRPVRTLTVEGGKRTTAGVTHYEPRKFTLAEVRRLCSFPADFVLTGSFSQRWERLGRSVPPVMMAAVARTVKGILDDINRGA